MKELKLFFSQIIKKFIRGSSDKTFENFLEYFYFTIDNKIKQTKQQSIKDKYIKIRQNAFYYVFANRKQIELELCKKKI